MKEYNVAEPNFFKRLFHVGGSGGELLHWWFDSGGTATSPAFGVRSGHYVAEDNYTHNARAARSDVCSALFSTGECFLFPSLS